MLLAEHFPAIRCVIARAAPVDVPSLTGNVRVAAETYLVPHGGPDRWSPAAWTDRLQGRVLLSAAASDPVVPPGQSKGMARLLGARAAIRLLPADPRGPMWVHARVSARAVGSYRRVERGFALRAVRAP